ncbi:MAG TPA: M20/M25/M40 family metallo-hydrolase [Dermatophilaceae bacterium]|nr:M20/M25/M40 family metallo-hydrolase [Dermatophilaceae bacterium]HQK32018.1 M20/M25/M40 family metallo-hydrolase [Phycicoccus sp.]
MDDLGDAAVALLPDLVAIDSVNPGLVEGAAGESAIVAFLANRLRANGFTVTIINAEGRANRPSLLAVGPGPSDAPTVVLNGHLDTVGVSGMPSPFTPRVEGHQLFGRGAADMKGGVAAMVVAAERLAADHLTTAHLATSHPSAERSTGSRGIRPVLALVADEEDASLGSEAVIAALAALSVQPDVCLIGEPTDLAPCRTLRGFGVARVSFPGRAAHSSQPHLGVNALTHLGRFLHAVDERAPHLHTEGSDLMVTVARGGSSAFVIPDSAECLVEIRTSPGGRGASVLEEIDALLHPAWGATVTLVAARDGWRLDDTGPAADLATRLGAALTTNATFDAPYWMEAPLWQAVCPTLICGPSGGGLHADDEWVDLRQVRAFSHALVNVLSSWSPEAH